MKAFLLTAVLVAGATSAEASEAWTCSYSTVPGLPTDTSPVLIRFELTPPDLIDTKTHDHYRILQNNDYGLVATLSISEIEEGHKEPTVGAVTVVINKGTGEFWWGWIIAGQAAVVNQPVHGKCLRD
jgi:hypothetical protein